MIAERIHLFPYRTQKLSFLTPKVLVGSLTGRIGNCHFLIYPFQGFPVADFFCVVESYRLRLKNSPYGGIVIRPIVESLRAILPKSYVMRVISICPIVESLQAPPKSYAMRVISICPIVESLQTIPPKNPLCGLPRMKSSFPTMTSRRRVLFNNTSLHT